LASDKEVQAHMQERKRACQTELHPELSCIRH
jgi:hypothetical protein